MSLYRRRGAVDRSLDSDVPSHTPYSRILAMASVDIMLTLPLGITTLSLFLSSSYMRSAPFYSGWKTIHADWAPTVKERKPYSVFITWRSPVLSFVIFALFGTTQSARMAYCTFVYAGCRRFINRPDTGCSTPGRFDSPSTSMKFTAHAAHTYVMVVAIPCPLSSERYR